MTDTVMSTDLPVNDPTNPAHRLADDLRNGRIPGYAADDVRAVLTMLAASPQGEGSSAAPIPTETDDAAVLDRVYWLCDGAQPGDYGAVIAAIRDAVLPTSYDELLRALTEMLAAYRGAVLLTADDELQRCADKAEALITKITEGA